MIASFQARRPEGHESPIRKVIYLWQTRDIQLLELFFSVVALPLWSAWLIIPFGSDSFASDSFRVLSCIAREEVWGLTGLAAAFVWTFGILEDCRMCRQVGSFSMALILLFVTYSLAIVAINSPGVPMYGSVAFTGGFLCVRQRWGIGAGES
jgi:hypothetical protein